MSRSKTRRSLRLENLEARKLLSADLSGTQQLMLELINEALVDPEAAADRVEQGLTRGAINAISNDGNTVEQVIAEIADADPRPPVAWDADLANAAEQHTEFQIKIGRQTHNGPKGLETATDRVIAAGYNDPDAVAENIIYGVDSPEHAMRAFLADYGKSNAKNPHRENIQQTDKGEKSHQEVGIAVLPVEVPIDASTPFGTPKAPKTETKLVVTQLFASKDEVAPKLLGVVYDDADGDQFYDVGEGIAGASVTITDKATGDATTVKTWASGGYQAGVQPGNYRIEVTLGDRLLGRRDTSVGQENKKVDFRVNNAPKSAKQTVSPTKETKTPSTRPALHQTQAASVSSTVRVSATKTKAAEPAPVAPPTLPTSAIDSSTLSTSKTPSSNPTTTPSATTGTGNLKAIDRLQNRSTRSQATAQAQAAGGSTITLLRSSLSGTLRSWKIADGISEADSALLSR